MDTLLASPALRCAAAALATALAVSALAHAGRLWGSGRWATTSALVLGSEDETRGDLRFAAFVAALAAAVAWVVALDRPLHELTQTGRAFVLVAGLPVVALFVAGLADILRVSPQIELATVPVEDAEPALPARVTAPVPGLIDRALAEVAAARARSADGSTHEALGSMVEALEDYREVAAQPGADQGRVASAVQEIVALARSCDDEESPAFATLGLKRDASFEDAKRVYRELARIYHADAALPGVAPEKFVELSEAFERVRAYLHQEAQ